MLNRILKAIFKNKIENKKIPNHKPFSALVNEYNLLIIESGMNKDYKGSGRLLKYIGKKFLGEDFMKTIPGPKRDLCEYIAVTHPDFYKKLANIYLEHGLNGVIEKYQELEI